MQRDIIEKAVEILAEKKGGEWILLGGSLARLCFGSKRSTYDIDIIGNPSNQASRTILMDTALELGLPVEALNSAADYYLSKIPNWEKELVKIRAGKAGNVYRPSITLFILLKLSRGSEADISDCEFALRSKNIEKFDKRKFDAWVKQSNLDFSQRAKDFLSTI